MGRGIKWSKQELQRVEDIITTNWGKVDFNPQSIPWWTQFTCRFKNRTEQGLQRVWYRRRDHPRYTRLKVLEARLTKLRGPQRSGQDYPASAEGDRNIGGIETSDDEHESCSSQAPSLPEASTVKTRASSDDSTKPEPSQPNRADVSSPQPAVKPEADSDDDDIVCLGPLLPSAPSAKGKEVARPGGVRSSSGPSTTAKQTDKRPRDEEPGKAGPSKRARTPASAQLLGQLAGVPIKSELGSNGHLPVYIRPEQPSSFSASTPASTRTDSHAALPSTNVRRSDARPLPTPSLSPSLRTTAVTAATSSAGASTSANGSGSSLPGDKKALFTEMLGWWSSAISERRPSGTDEELDLKYREIWKQIAAERGIAHKKLWGVFYDKNEAFVSVANALLE